MKQKLVKVLKIIAFFALGLVLFWLVYKDQDIDRIKSVLKNDVNYLWIWVSLLLGLLSHLSRTLRWILMIEPLGHKPRVLNTFLAVMVGYLMNLVVPRMGEISRCGVLSRYEKISFTKLVGTVVTERIIDVIMLLLLTMLVLVSQFGKILQFLENNPHVKQKFDNFTLTVWDVLALAGIVLAFYFFRKKIKKSAALVKVHEIMLKFGEGLKTIKNMKNKWAFILHSVFIWLMYYLMLYVVFFCFEFTAHLAPLAALTTFVLGSFGMVAPVQGGIGAWHFMVIQALIVYGVSKADGVVFAFLAHGTMTAMLIVMGLISVLALPFLNRQAH
ncbi:lysylphosphatidylglycerol synthase transmembrane domain-containing protein [Gaoshiqia sediminis]|uniref:Flippase-like domain-containing protein n=1 Tax=Gaoshiqia sediminis TaxID=2986998 RepID=A0AA41Y807_9BACT|nr:lysylphosphatidylglycerol synthase transmembrane domain-containing protein [Gaoshiqia sediminis]MCW0482593.1 flippase-like domain-containing protein [Gaoshiqia sediminis]